MYDHVLSRDPISLSQSLCIIAAEEMQAANAADSNTSSPLELLAMLECLRPSCVSRSDPSLKELVDLGSDESSSDSMELDADRSGLQRSSSCENSSPWKRSIRCVIFGLFNISKIEESDLMFSIGGQV